MIRALSLYLPHWPIDRWWYRRRPEPRGVTLLARRVAERQVVVGRCARAAEYGITLNMTLAEARALLSGDVAAGLTVIEQDEDGDRRALRRLAQWANRFAPRVAADAPDGLLMDVSGCQRLYRGEHNLVTPLRRALTGRGFACRVAVAPTYGAAWALARYAPTVATIVTGRDGWERALGPLPIEGLRLEAASVAALHEVGITTVAQLRAVPRRQLPARFADVLPRLEQALGHRLETITPVRPRPQARVTYAADGVIGDRRAIAAVTRRLLGKLVRRLEPQGLGVRQLRLTLERYHDEPVRLSLEFSHPTGDAEHLWRLLEPRLGQLKLGKGVETVTLAATATEHLKSKQTDMPALRDEDAITPARAAELGQLIDILASSLGRDQLRRVTPVASYIPERAFRHVAVDAREATAAATVTLERPTWLFDPPEPIQAQCLTPDGPVLQFRWRGALYRARQCLGPERLTSEWWNEPTGARDYFHVQTETGQHLWLYREERSRAWYVHGHWS